MVLKWIDSVFHIRFAAFWFYGNLGNHCKSRLVDIFDGFVKGRNPLGGSPKTADFVKKCWSVQYSDGPSSFGSFGSIHWVSESNFILFWGLLPNLVLTVDLPFPFVHVFFPLICTCVWSWNTYYLSSWILILYVFSLHILNAYLFLVHLFWLVAPPLRWCWRSSWDWVGFLREWSMN